ncbi:Type cbb3 cytochrome oxidase biogenesis protein CcoG, involved in Cu oxidation [hydrothermal vent metagenome]|uniref:Type cbb3 cytochrome oxidase biogenesis protein CcoG, involved in Cu oxidation n=1 Tax=hydrothermal vent metagenome TaxID=652676 RepID=A0A3B1BRT7_9ZZZZ
MVKAVKMAYSDWLDRRRMMQAAFFLLFVLAPPLDLLRLDLTLGHFIFMGHNWTLGIDDFLAGKASASEAALNIVLRAFLPLAMIVATGFWLAWKYGRLYCGWLCPHYSVVEMINGLMRRTFGRFSLWDREPIYPINPDGRRIESQRRYWIPLLFASSGFAFLWAVVLLSYLLPPAEIYHNLLHAELTHGQFIFIAVATIALFVEFMFARHLFCRYACAVGFFQSLIWMANKKALVVALDRERVADCASCHTACEQACPMRLKPRTIKRKMFTCTECGRCLDACEQVQAGGHGNAGKIQTPLLQWVNGECARDVSERDFGKRPDIPGDCFKRKAE